MPTSASPNLVRSGTLNVLIAGLVTGTLDALAAIFVYQADPAKLFQYIASAATGPDAFSGGTTSAMVGVFFHFLIATVWCALLFSVYTLLVRLFRHWILVGMVWGVIVWCGMNLLVLPLSRLSLRPFDVKSALTAIIILVVAVGIPAAFIVSRRMRS